MIFMYFYSRAKTPAISQHFSPSPENKISYVSTGSFELDQKLPLFRQPSLLQPQFEAYKSELIDDNISNMKC